MHAEDGSIVLEALVALSLLAAVSATVLSIATTEFDRSAQNEIAARRHIEVSSLVARLGVDLPLQIGVIETPSMNGGIWRTTIRPYDEPGMPIAPNGRGLVRIEVAFIPSKADSQRAAQKFTFLRPTSAR